MAFKILSGEALVGIIMFGLVFTGFGAGIGFMATEKWGWPWFVGGAVTGIIVGVLVMWAVGKVKRTSGKS